MVDGTAPRTSAADYLYFSWFTVLLGQLIVIRSLRNLSAYCCMHRMVNSTIDDHPYFSPIRGCSDRSIFYCPLASSNWYVCWHRALQGNQQRGNAVEPQQSQVGKLGVPLPQTDFNPNTTEVIQALNLYSDFAITKVALHMF